MSLQPGTVIAGKYEVVKCLGAGSMGLVYACRKRGEMAGEMVAVKVLFPEVAQDKTAAARFRNEIFAAYGVSHPNVVKASEYIRECDLLAYTMEFVSGGDLAQKLGRHTDPLPIAEIVRLLSQMCGGVQAIHDSGIVHRDLKPENILLTKEGDVKIADFGIARLETGPARKLTEHGGVVGTIDYVAPEYLLNSQIDGRADIYALGILGYEMIVGESPFRGDTVYDTMTKRLKSDPVPPSHLRAECPRELDAIILKAMARAPESRFQTASEMLVQLQALPLRNISPDMYEARLAARGGGSPSMTGGAAGVALGEGSAFPSFEGGGGRAPGGVVERTADVLGGRVRSDLQLPDPFLVDLPQDAPVRSEMAPFHSAPSPLRAGSPHPHPVKRQRDEAEDESPLVVGPLERYKRRPHDSVLPVGTDSQGQQTQQQSALSFFALSKDEFLLLWITILVISGIGLLVQVFGVGNESPEVSSGAVSQSVDDASPANGGVE